MAAEGYKQPTEALEEALTRQLANERETKVNYIAAAESGCATHLAAGRDTGGGDGGQQAQAVEGNKQPAEKLAEASTEQLADESGEMPKDKDGATSGCATHVAKIIKQSVKPRCKYAAKPQARRSKSAKWGPQGYKWLNEELLPAAIEAAQKDRNKELMDIRKQMVNIYAEMTPLERAAYLQARQEDTGRPYEVEAVKVEFIPAPPRVKEEQNSPTTPTEVDKLFEGLITWEEFTQ